MRIALKNLPLLTLTAFLSLLLIHTWFGPDVWYHLTWARSMWQNGSLMPTTQTLIAQPIVANPYWLFQFGLFGAYSLGGVPMVSLAFLCLWLAIAGLWLRITEAYLHPLTGTLFFFVFIVCAQLRFEARPEILSYLFLSTYLLLLQSRTPGKTLGYWKMAALFVMQILWINSHSYFIFGLAAALLSGSISAIVVTALASLTSPFGPYLWVSLWDYAQLAPQMKEFIHELMPPRFTASFPLGIFWIYFVSIVAFAVHQIYRRKMPMQVMWAGLGLFLSFQASRNIPLLMIFSAPLAKELILFLETWLRQRPWLTEERLQKFTVTLTSLIAALALSVMTGHYHRWVYSMGAFGIGVEKSAFPVDAVEYLKSIDFKGNLFTDSYDGGYAEFMMPEIKVAGDSYFSDSTLTLKYFAAIRNPRALEELNRLFSFDALLINIENVDELADFMNNKVWRMVYADSHRVLFVNHGRFEEAQFDLRKTKFYTGEDLRSLSYAFGANTWAGMAFKNRDAPLMSKLLEDLQTAKAIPSTALRFALQLGLEHRNSKILAAALNLAPRVYEFEPGEMIRLNPLIEQARRAGFN